jgi:hypothetical protein
MVWWLQCMVRRGAPHSNKRQFVCGLHLIKAFNFADVFPSSEERSRLARMGGQNGGVASGRFLGKPSRSSCHGEPAMRR